MCRPRARLPSLTPAQSIPPAPEVAAPKKRQRRAEVAAPAVKPMAKPMASTLERRIVWDLDWAAIPILLLLLVGIVWWKYRRQPAAPAPVATASARDGLRRGDGGRRARLFTGGSRPGPEHRRAANPGARVGPNALDEKRVTLLQRILPHFWGRSPG